MNRRFAGLGCRPGPGKLLKTAEERRLFRCRVCGAQIRVEGSRGLCEGCARPPLAT